MSATYLRRSVDFKLASGFREDDERKFFTIARAVSTFLEIEFRDMRSGSIRFFPDKIDPRTRGAALRSERFPYTHSIPIRFRAELINS